MDWDAVLRGALVFLSIGHYSLQAQTPQVSASSCPFTDGASKIGKSLVDLGVNLASELAGGTQESCSHNPIYRSQRILDILDAKTKPIKEQISKAYKELSDKNNELSKYVYKVILQKLVGPLADDNAQAVLGQSFHIVIDQLRINVKTIESSRVTLDQYLTDPNGFRRDTQMCAAGISKVVEICFPKAGCVVERCLETAADVAAYGAELMVDSGLTIVAAQRMQAALNRIINMLEGVLASMGAGTHSALMGLSRAIALAGQFQPEVSTQCINMGGAAAYVWHQLPEAQRTFLDWMIRASHLFGGCEVDAMLKFILSSPGFKEWVEDMMAPVACTMSCMTNLVNQVPLPVPHPYLSGGNISVGYSAGALALGGGRFWDLFMNVDNRPTADERGIYVGISSIQTAQVVSSFAQAQVQLGVGLHAGCYKRPPEGGSYVGRVGAGWNYIVNLGVAAGYMFGVAEKSSGSQMLSGWVTSPTELVVSGVESLVQKNNFEEFRKKYLLDKNSSMYQVLLAFPIDKIFEIVFKRTLLTPQSLIDISQELMKSTQGRVPASVSSPTTNSADRPLLGTVLRGQFGNPINAVLANPFSAHTASPHMFENDVGGYLKTSDTIFERFFKNLREPIKSAAEALYVRSHNKGFGPEHFANNIDPAWLYVVMAMVQSLDNSTSLANYMALIEQYVSEHPVDNSNPWINIDHNKHMTLQEYFHSRLRWAHWVISLIKSVPSGLMSAYMANTFLGPVTVSLLVESMMIGPEKSDVIGFNQNRTLTGCMGVTAHFSAGVGVGLIPGVSLMQGFSSHTNIPDTPYHIPASTCQKLASQIPSPTLASFFSAYMKPFQTGTIRLDPIEIFQRMLTPGEIPKHKKLAGVADVLTKSGYVLANPLFQRVSNFGGMLSQACTFGTSYPGLSPVKSVAAPSSAVFKTYLNDLKTPELQTPVPDVTRKLASPQK